VSNDWAVRTVATPAQNSRACVADKQRATMG